MGQKRPHDDEREVLLVLVQLLAGVEDRSVAGDRWEWRLCCYGQGSDGTPGVTALSEDFRATATLVHLFAAHVAAHVLWKELTPLEVQVRAAGAANHSCS